MSIFNNYKNVDNSTTFTNIEACVDNNISHKPLAQYDMRGDLVGYTWNYGDAITLEFIISGVITDEDSSQYTTIDDYLEGKSLAFTVFNNRHNEIFSTETNGSRNCLINISKELSETKFIRGCYTCQLELIDGDNSQVIFSENDGKLNVI